METILTTHLYLLRVVSIGRFFNYSERNGIGYLGMTRMPDFRMEQLMYLSLGSNFYYSEDNNIGSNGIKMLIKADLPQLGILKIGYD